MPWLSKLFVLKVILLIGSTSSPNLTLNAKLRNSYNKKCMKKICMNYLISLASDHLIINDWLVFTIFVVTNMKIQMNMAYTTTYTSSRNSTMSNKRGKKILLVKLEIIYPLPKCMLISVLPNRLTMVLLQPSLEPTHDGLKICMCDKQVQMVKMIMVMQQHVGAVFKITVECNCLAQQIDNGAATTKPTHDGLKICMWDKHVQIVKMIMVMQYHTGAVFKMIMECNCIQEWCLR